MRLEGIHHITAITGDAPRNVDFYTRVLGLRLVAKVDPGAVVWPADVPVAAGHVEHADAAVKALQEVGIRAVFGYGFFESSPFAPPHFAAHAETRYRYCGKLHEAFGWNRRSWSTKF